MTAFHRSAAWAAFVRTWRPRIRAQGTAQCIRCGGLIDLTATDRGNAWDLGHRLDAVTHPELALDPENVGPEHRHRVGRCAGNRSAGGTLGRRRQTARDRRRRGTPSW